MSRLGNARGGAVEPVTQGPPGLQSLQHGMKPHPLQTMAESNQHHVGVNPGKVAAAPAVRAVGVSPTLLSASHRLLTPGPPPLRVERIGAMLAEHLLQEEWTFTRWVDQQGMQGATQREAKTIARALELATHDFGAAYLVSRPAEVQLRRLLALALSAKVGWRTASLLEELPGDNALSAVPDSILKSLQERLKLELKIEEAAKAKGKKD